jgi:hypothetical protein
MTLRGLRLALVLCLLTLSSSALAHKPSDSYLRLGNEDGAPAGRWDIALRDLDDALGIDRDGDGAITWGELRAAEPRITSYARRSLRASTAAGACRLSFGTIATISHSDGAYAALPLGFACPGDVRRLKLHYDLLFAVDAQHRGVLRLTGGARAPIVFTKSSRGAQLDLDAAADSGSLLAMIGLGVDHILHGYDHLLFLTALLLPSVLRREGKRWVAAKDLRAAVTDVLRIVTAFTLAHSITLGLAAAHLIALPPRFVESAIALSVALAALNNLFPVVRSERWLLTFGLGLLHGFGFAATLSDVGLSGTSFVRTLFGFNLGVEIGQLGVVLLLLPLIASLRRSAGYQRFGLQLGSSAVLLVSSLWLLERAFALRIIS